jgi:hypothetical protein
MPTSKQKIAQPLLFSTYTIATVTPTYVTDIKMHIMVKVTQRCHCTHF